MTIPAAIGIAAGAVLLAVGLSLLVRRLAPPEGLWGTPEPNHSGSSLAALGSGFAILVAFVLFVAFQGYLGARNQSDEEANATERMFHASEVFPAPLRRGLHAELICYARSVIALEWPLLEEGEESRQVDAWTRTLEVIAGEAELRDPLQAQALADYTDTNRDRDNGRRERLQEAQPAVPSLLWVALITGAVVLVVYVASFSRREVRLGVQVLPVAAIALVATLNLCVIRFLDIPYSDVAGSVKPTAMQKSLANMTAELREEYPDTRIPCDQSGRPASQR
jgi:hypothetical protein